MPEENLLNKVISFIAGGDDGGDDRQVLLKQLAREIPQNKYAKFYRARQEEADPSFAQYFYSIYKIISPARSFLRDPAVMVRIRQITLESYLDKSVMDIIKRLDLEVIMERKQDAGPDFTEELEKDLAALTAGFDSPKLAAADECYNLITTFNKFVSWDYYGLLRKFDPELSENFSAPPKFAPLRVDTIMADIASFLSILPLLDPADDWKTAFEILKYCKGGGDLIPLEIWNGVLANLKDIGQSKMLNMMVRLASGNPIWEAKAVPPVDEHLSSGWLAEKSAGVRQIISSIAGNQKNAQIASLEKAVFGGVDTKRLTYYTREKGRIFTQKDVDSYVYAPALNHLTAFIQDFMQKEMQEFSDILLVRGQWTNNAASKDMSEAYHSIVEIIPQIEELDDSLAEDGSNGPRIKGALLRIDRDQSQARYLNSIVGSINDDALDIINETVPHFIAIGKHLKVLLEDSQKKAYELIMNWKELGLVSKTPIVQRISDDYKKLNYFVQLMLLESKDDE